MTQENAHPHLSQLDDLERFVEAATGRVIHAVGDRERWLVFDGNTWTSAEAATAARELALETVRHKHAQLDEEKARHSYAAQRLNLTYPGVLVRGAEQDPRLRRPAAEF
ncbi:MAG: hypothetical protein ACO3UM_18480, partial [Planctomycetota bacterium]